jgi:hypothetical protein
MPVAYHTLKIFVEFPLNMPCSKSHKQHDTNYFDTVLCVKVVGITLSVLGERSALRSSPYGV